MSLSPRDELAHLLAELDLPNPAGVLDFYEKLLEENEIQNLTRLTSPQAFLEGHLIDVIELRKSRLVDFPAVDLGSGGGVPGLLSAVIDPQLWSLVESEKKKAEFLEKTAISMGLSGSVSVFGQRIEEFLRNRQTQSIVARAVGPIDRIYGWIRSCSTWNNLVLLKGPSWEEEWERFSQGKHKRELEVQSVYSYSVGADQKQRKIIKIRRVPRGTSKK